MDSEDDFRKAVADATPLRRKARAQLKAPAPQPVARQRGLDEAAVLAESLDGWAAEDVLDTEEDLSFLRDGMSPEVLRKLRRGHWALQAQIDLHGLRRDGAREAMSAFIHDAARRGLRCVRVVHGKGHGSPGREPVLKGRVRRWLVQKEEVLAFVQAKGSDGGAGALMVLLDGSRPHNAQAGADTDSSSKSNS